MNFEVGDVVYVEIYNNLGCVFKGGSKITYADNVYKLYTVCDCSTSIIIDPLTKDCMRLATKLERALL